MRNNASEIVPHLDILVAGSHMMVDDFRSKRKFFRQIVVDTHQRNSFYLLELNISETVSGM